MPGPLRRLQSNPSDASVHTLDGSRCTRAREEDTVTPPPNRRRRLVIKGASCTASKPTASALFLEASSEFLANTPSREDGVSEEVERIERFSVCHAAREAVRTCLRTRAQESPAEISHDLKLRAQVLACYLVQVFFMSTSLRRENHAITAVTAAVTALKALGIECGDEDALQLCRSGNGPLKGCMLDSQTDSDLLDMIFPMEARLLSTLGTPSPGALSHFDRPMQSLTALLLNSLHGDQAAQLDADCVSESELKQVTERFIMDAFQGLGPLILSPDAIVAGAIVMATKHILFRRRGPDFSPAELIQLLCLKSESTLKSNDLESALQEIKGVYRIMKESQGMTVTGKPVQHA